MPASFFRALVVVCALAGCAPSSGAADSGLVESGASDAPLLLVSQPGGWILLQHGLVRGTIARFYGEGGYYSSRREDRCTQAILSDECLGVLCRPDAPFTNAHPGTLTIDVSDGADLEAAPDALGEYTNDPAGWRSGSVVSVSAPGGGLPAFSVSVTMPDAPTSFPSLPAEVSRSAGLSLAPLGGATSSRVRFEIPPDATTSYPTYVVDCVFASGASVVVPPSVLAFLPNGRAQVALEAANREVREAAGMRIDLLAANSGPDSTERFVQLVD